MRVEVTSDVTKGVYVPLRSIIDEIMGRFQYEWTSPFPTFVC